MTKKQQEEEGLTELEVPEFKSHIPSFLADGLEPKDREILATLSIIAQKQDFLLSVIKDDRKKLEEAFKIAKRHEKLVLILTSRYSLLIYVPVLFLPALASKWVSKFWP